MPQTTAPNSKRRLAITYVIALIAVMIVLIAAVAWTRSQTGNSASPKTQADFGHVHGLGVDPESGDLYAGTHYGVFKINETGETSQIGPTRDYMGFTITSTGRFLASGHPGISEDAPGMLGLIESTDSGEKWKTLSLSGNADFHTLEVNGNRIYGHTGGQLMVSDDGKNWSARAERPIDDLAIHPADVNSLVATTQDGLIVSSNAGTTFTPLPQRNPALSLLTWPDESSLFGLSSQGQVEVSNDGGRTWEQRGTVGAAVDAITATRDALYVATPVGIVKSVDGGRTFITIARNSQ